jgi:Chaperone of endosialidase
MKTKLRLKLSSLAAAALLPLTFSALQSTAVAVPTTITYQGRVNDNGVPFSGTGAFKFALVTSSNVAAQATATAQLTGTFVTSCAIVNPGNGYVTPPAVTFIGGGGSNATATAMISGGAVTNITINNSGAGYTTAPSVLIAPPPPLLAFVSYWSNDGTSFNGSEPVSAVNVSVTNGLFTVVLGDPTAGMVTLDSSLFSLEPNLQLRIWFNDGLNGSAVLSPVQNLTPAPYAVEALSASASSLTSIGNVNGGNNLFVGQSGNPTTSGYNNTGMGAYALTDLTSGHDNVAIGFESLYVNTNGAYNTAYGNYTLTFNANGVGNAAFGYADLEDNRSGSYNAAYGTYAMQDNTSGSFNSVLGDSAMQDNTTGSNNVAIGYQALQFVNAGSGNIAIGEYAGTTIVNGVNNILIGNTGFNDESNVIRIGTTQTKAVMLGIYPTTIQSSAGIVCVNPSGLLGTGAAGATLGSDLSLVGGGASYHNLSLSGGNAFGYLYGSFPALNDGIHLGYNWYYDANGTGHISNSGGGTSRISADYGEIVLAVGGVNAAPTTTRIDVTTSGVTVSGTFNNNSDRNAKKNFAPVSPSQILDKVTQLPLSEWSYKDDAATRHVGPMAQDFYSIFNVGTDEKHIAPIDEGGVALAAIQGLNQKVEEKDKKILEQESMIQRQSAEIADMKERLEKLEQHLLNHDSN